MENGKYLFFEKGGKAYILRTDNEKKSTKICKMILDGFMKFNSLDYKNYSDEVVNNTIENIKQNSSFVELENKDGYISLKSKYFGGAYKFNDFVVC